MIIKISYLKILPLLSKALSLGSDSIINNKMDIISKTKNQQDLKENKYVIWSKEHLDFYNFYVKMIIKIWKNIFIIKSVKMVL